SRRGRTSRRPSGSRPPGLGPLISGGAGSSASGASPGGGGSQAQGAGGPPRPRLQESRAVEEGAHSRQRAPGFGQTPRQRAARVSGRSGAGVGRRRAVD